MEKVPIWPTRATKNAGSVRPVGGMTVWVTASVKGALSTAPAPFDTTTSNTAPLSASTVDEVLNVALVAPAMGAPSRRHWNVIGDDPLAATLSVAASPATTETVCGTLLAMAGAIGLTVSVALLLSAVPIALPTRTEKVAPVSLNCDAGIVNVASVAP